MGRLGGVDKLIDKTARVEGRGRYDAFNPNDVQRGVRPRRTQAGAHPAFQQVQRALAKREYFDSARKIAERLGMESERVGSRTVVGAYDPFSNIVGDVQAGLTLWMNFFDTFQTTHAVEDVGHRRRLASSARASRASSRTTCGMRGSRARGRRGRG